MQITVTIDVDDFDDIQEYDNKGTIQSLDDVEIEGLPECLENAVDILSKQGCWRLLQRLDTFIRASRPDKIAYLCHAYEREKNLDAALSETIKVRLRKVEYETFTHDGVTYEVTRY